MQSKDIKQCQHGFRNHCTTVGVKTYLVGRWADSLAEHNLSQVFHRGVGILIRKTEIKTETNINMKLKLNEIKKLKEIVAILKN